MGIYNITDITIGVVIFVFVVLFGTSLISVHVDKYNIGSNPTTGMTYSEYEQNLSTYRDDVEDEYEKTKVKDGDAEGLLGTIGTIKKIFTIRDTVSDLQTDVEEDLFFLPKQFWEMIGIIVAIILVTTMATIFWRTREGLTG
ncbi:MAG: hypothetical protein D4S01_05855 [Dehalococcoidia bacterium]|nr:MAG: hypothetical protein D4S01_05855 [Dehalococcoidia bacterium]